MNFSLRDLSLSGCAALLVAVVAVSSGCNRGPAMAQVSGHVFMKDGSVPKGGVRVVRFEPIKDSTAAVRKAASGPIQDDGSFTMYTQFPGDGVHVGEYAVTFGVMKGPMDPISLIDAKYTSAATSPYKVTVDGDLEGLKYEIEPLPGGGSAAGR
jgi:hypothetical protein